MNLLLTVLSITLVQLPGLAIRYLPFSEVINIKQKKAILWGYSLVFLLQNIILYFFLKNNIGSVTPLTYKRLIFLCAVAYIFINIFIIKNCLFRHLFILSMQSGYSIFLHSIIAVMMGMFGNGIPVYRQLAMQTMFYTLLFAVITIPLWKHVRKTLLYKYSTVRDYYWNIIWLIPAIAVYSDVIVTMNDQWINTWPQIVSRILMAIALIVSWKCIYLDFEAIDKLQNLESNNKLLYIQKESILEQANILKDNEKKIRIFKHDMRHNLQILLSLVEHQYNDDAIRYIKQLRDDLQSTKPIKYCNNPVVNAALLVYITRAEEQAIEVIAEVDMPENIIWNSNDLAILFANALENAYNASLKQKVGERKIMIKAKYASDKLVIKFKNRFDDDIEFGLTGFPTPKEKGHGIGTQSMLTIIDKYNAHASCSYEEGWFSMTFLFSVTEQISLNKKGEIEWIS